MSKWNLKFKTWCHLYVRKTTKLIRKIKEEPNKWSNIPCSWIRRLIVKISVLSLIDIFTTVPVKIQASYFIISANWFWSLYWEAKDEEESTQYWRRKQSQRTDTDQLQNVIYSYSHQDSIKNKQIDKWNKKSSQIDPTNIINWSLIKEQQQYNGLKTVF